MKSLFQYCLLITLFFGCITLWFNPVPKGYVADVERIGQDYSNQMELLNDFVKRNKKDIDFLLKCEEGRME